MDLDLAAQQATAIRNALVNLLPHEKELIESRIQQLQLALLDLNNQFKLILNNNSISVVYFHKIYQYFQRAYQLQGPSLHWEPDQNIAEDQLQELKHLQDHHAIAVLIWALKASWKIQWETDLRREISWKACGVILNRLKQYSVSSRQLAVFQ